MFTFASFDDRSDLAALSEEMRAHEVAQYEGLLKISFTFGFETLQQAKAACALASGPGVMTLTAGTKTLGVCSISLQGIPTPASLSVVREAAQPVAAFPGAKAGKWSALREATPAERGEPSHRYTFEMSLLTSDAEEGPVTVSADDDSPVYVETPSGHRIYITLKRVRNGDRDLIEVTSSVELSLDDGSERSDLPGIYLSGPGLAEIGAESDQAGGQLQSLRLNLESIETM
mgnify:CR=1 FL=1